MRSLTAWPRKFSGRFYPGTVWQCARNKSRFCAVVRKGKERFVCDARLAERTALVHPKRTREKNSLRIAENILDMDHIPELSRYDRCRICITVHIYDVLQ